MSDFPFIQVIQTCSIRGLDKQLLKVELLSTGHLKVTSKGIKAVAKAENCCINYVGDETARICMMAWPPHHGTAVIFDIDAWDADVLHDEIREIKVIREAAA